MMVEETNSEYLSLALLHYEKHKMYWQSQGYDTLTKVLFVKAFKNAVMDQYKTREFAKKIDPSKMPKTINIPPEYLQDGTF